MEDWSVRRIQHIFAGVKMEGLMCEESWERSLAKSPQGTGYLSPTSKRNCIVPTIWMSLETDSKAQMRTGSQLTYLVWDTE